MPLADADRAKLDGIVQKMESNGEKPEDIQLLVNDFKQKYAGPQMDAFQKAVNYHTGNSLIDAPLGLVQGAAKGMADIGESIGDLTRKVTGQAPQSQQQRELDTKPEGIGQGTGKFLEQAAEYAVPSAMAGKALKGAGLLTRAAGQAAVGGGVSALQSGGDPTSIAVGALAGAGGEAAGAAIKGAKALVGAKQPTLANFAESFGNATPTQKARISAALPTLVKDGIQPAEDVHAMQDAIKLKVLDLQRQYQALPAAIKQRPMLAKEVIDGLQEQQQKYTLRGVVNDEGVVTDRIVTNKEAYNALQDQIQTIKAIGKQTGGHVNVDDLIHLKQNANGKTNFTSPDAEKSLWKGVGDVYRNLADKLAPETTPLNKDYQKYKDLEQLVDQNIDRGKGTTPSGLDNLMTRAASHTAGAGAGYAIGHAIGGPVVGAAGSVAGSIIGPKLAKAAGQAIQNAVDSGAFAKLTPAAQKMLAGAAKAGDSGTVYRLLSRVSAGAIQNVTQQPVAQ